ncbi:hypothetical protein [Streptomyces sp. NEAU-S7GS2]|nr:hypothetical protein [Streptomyces sp. NEAU-S7GS2]
MNLEELRQQAVRIHDLYDEMNRYERGRVWTPGGEVLAMVCRRLAAYRAH